MATLMSRQPGAIKQGPPRYSNIHSEAQYQEEKQEQEVDLSNMQISTIPHNFPNYSIINIKQLKLDHNNIQQCTIDPSLYCHLKVLSIQHNSMHKFSIKRLLQNSNQLQLKDLNLSYNKLQFLDISSVINLRTLSLSHNNLSTIILPESHLQILDISHNLFSNIQYSVLSGRVFPKLTYLNASHNNKSLYDLILCVKGIQLVPSLIELDCSHNILSYFQSLPLDLRSLNLEHNQLIFDRQTVNQIIRLRNLENLRISGNSISSTFLELIRTKINRGHKKDVIIYLEDCQGVKQSPYKLYQVPQSGKKNIVYSNFTLGEEANVDEIDPDYNLLEPQIPASLKKPEKMEPKVPHYQNLQNSADALLSAENKLKPKKFKFSIDGDRFQNHYKFYFQKLQDFMSIPLFPITHQDRSKNISVRIDPPEDQELLNEFHLINEMFRKRGGVHYVRKVFNWAKSQQIKRSTNTVMFVNLQLSKQQFQKICGGDYSLIDKTCSQKHSLNHQPCSFSVYHILAKIGSCLGEQSWSCLYLIQAAQL